MSARKVVMLATAAVFVSACRSTPPTIETVECREEESCERHAEQKCKTKNYRVQLRTKLEEDKEARPLAQRTGASDINGALGQGMGGTKRYYTDEPPPQWRYTVECNPRTPDPKLYEGATTTFPELTPEQLAARKKNKEMYMRAVCELTDPIMRREELEIARQQYGKDVSCP